MGDFGFGNGCGHANTNGDGYGAGQGSAGGTGYGYGFGDGVYHKQVMTEAENDERHSDAFLRQISRESTRPLRRQWKPNAARDLRRDR